MTRSYEPALDREELQKLELQAAEQGISPEELMASIVRRFLDGTNNTDPERRKGAAPLLAKKGPRK